MNAHLAYSLTTLADLGGIEIVVNQYASDDKIIIFGRRYHSKHDGMRRVMFIEAPVSIWDLKTGIYMENALWRTPRSYI